MCFRPGPEPRHHVNKTKLHYELGIEFIETHRLKQVHMILNGQALGPLGYKEQPHLFDCCRAGISFKADPVSACAMSVFSSPLLFLET